MLAIINPFYVISTTELPAGITYINIDDYL